MQSSDEEQMEALPDSQNYLIKFKSPGPKVRVGPLRNKDSIRKIEESK